MTTLDSTVSIWVRQGIADYVWGDVVPTPEFRQWMKSNVGEDFGVNLWSWDHFREEREVSIFFKFPRHATLFKLTWM